MTQQRAKIQLTERRLVGIQEIPFIQQGEKFLVDARVIHLRLQSRQKFVDWIKNRISDYGFNENEDFFLNLGKSTGGRKAHEYLLTLDTAKELAMVERNEIGRSIRRYFIAKEKELRGISHLPKATELFKGLRAKNINGRKLYPYREVLERCGYKRSTNGGRAQRYWMHFVKENNVYLVTEEFALHLHHSRQVYNNRQVMRASQPVIPSLFGDTTMLKLPSHA